MPPRHGKSETCSIWTPAWYLNRWPERHVILASYEADFAAHWGRRTRNVIDEHQDELLVRLSEDSTAANRWHTDAGGSMITAGVGGPITGRGAHLLILDDPHKNAEEAYSTTQQERLWEWWTSTALTRLEPGAAVIVIQTRWHEGDLAGRILKHEGSRWRVVRLPALAEEGDPIGRVLGEALWADRYDEQALADTRRSVGSRVWAAGYQQAPVAEEGAMFRRAWFEHRYDRQGEEHFQLEGGQVLHQDALTRFATVDLAASVRTSADYSVIMSFGKAPDGRLLLLDIDRARREGPDLVPAMRRAELKWDLTSVWIEKVGFQLAIVQEARRAGVRVRELETKGDKVARALKVEADMEGARLLLPRSAPWLDDFIAECLAFPNGVHDDQVDALAYGALAAGNVGRGSITLAGWRKLNEDDDDDDDRPAFGRLFGYHGPSHVSGLFGDRWPPPDGFVRRSPPPSLR
jgi:predicted phage terminase large subunit-like protein